jgi:hypothetical protein
MVHRGDFRLSAKGFRGPGGFAESLKGVIELGNLFQFLALAGRVATDLIEIIKLRPREYARVLRLLSSGPATQVSTLRG